MMRRRVLIIVNPAAGGLCCSWRRLDRVVAALRRRGCTVIARRTSPEGGDAERLARDAEPDFDIIVAAGGDGTLNAVANGLAGGERALGVLPLGTVNVLAREIGLPRHTEALAELILAGAARPIWPGRVDGRLFLMMASSGFDAEIVAAVNPRLKRRFGRLAFAWAMAVGWWRYRASRLSVRIGDADYSAAGVIAANGRFYAGPYIVAPQADLAAPMLDLVLLRRAGRVAMLRYLTALVLGRLAQRDDIAIVRAAEAHLSAEAPLPVQADGEIVARLPVRIAIAERPVWLVQP